jgi:dihydroorotate dehydrogenase
MDALGFGYVIPGSIRGGVASDNPKPKLLRDVERESLVNCTGLPSKGAAYAAAQLRRIRQVGGGAAVIPSIQGFTIEEYLSCLDAVQSWADAIEVPLHCPNERYDEMNFLDPTVLTDLLTALGERKNRPFCVKIRNFHDESERANRLRLVEICLEHGVEAITLPGSMTVAEPRLSLGKGNLSGRAVFDGTLRNLTELRRVTEGRVSLKALGGVFTAHDAFRAIAAGASSVELLTGLVYRGWTVAREINRGLLALMERAGIADVTELCGSDATLPDDGR